MPKKLLALTMALLLLNLLCVAPVAAAPKQAAGAKRAEEVRGAIAKLGTGAAAKVEVRLRDGAQLKGHVRESDDTHFVVVDAKTGAATTVMYPQVQKVRGHNLSTGAKIAIGVGLTVGVLLLMVGLCSVIDSCSGA